MFDDQFIYNLAVRVPIVLLALTVHEFSHAYLALRMGDPTACRMGRCTLNPLAHLDPLGTICLLFAPIGWAKPVPVNAANFHDPGKGDLITSAGGPLSNIVQALLFGLALRGLAHFAAGSAGDESGQWSKLLDTAVLMCALGVIINIGLAVFNLLPLYPLDGFHVTLQLLKPDRQQQFLQTAMFGPFVIIGLVIIGRVGGVNILSRLIEPPATLIFRYVAGVSEL